MKRQDHCCAETRSLRREEPTSEHIIFEGNSHCPLFFDRNGSTRIVLPDTSDTLVLPLQTSRYTPAERVIPHSTSCSSLSSREMRLELSGVTHLAVTTFTFRDFLLFRSRSFRELPVGFFREAGPVFRIRSISNTTRESGAIPVCLSFGKKVLGTISNIGQRLTVQAPSCVLHHRASPRHVFGHSERSSES